MSTERINNSETLSYKLSSSTKPALNSPVKLDTTNKGFVIISTAATDVIIGAISNVESTNTADVWQVQVPLSAPVKIFKGVGTIAIGKHLITNTAGQVVAQDVDLSAPGNSKWSCGIALSALGSGVEGDVEVLQLQGYIPTA